MKKLFLRIFRRPSVNGVLKNFHRTIAALEMVKKYHDDNAAEMSAAISRAEAERDASQKEALQADAVATKLRGIVGL